MDFIPGIESALPSISRKWNWASFYSTLRKGWFCFWFSAVSVSTCKWIKGLISEIVEIKEAINCKVWAKVHVGCDSGKMISQLIASLWYGDRTIKEILWPAQWQMRIRVPCLFVSSVINGSKVEQLKKNEKRTKEGFPVRHYSNTIHPFVRSSTAMPTQPTATRSGSGSGQKSSKIIPVLWLLFVQRVEQLRLIKFQWRIAAAATEHTLPEWDLNCRSAGGSCCWLQQFAVPAVYRATLDRERASFES